MLLCIWGIARLKADHLLEDIKLLELLVQGYINRAQFDNVLGHFYGKCPTLPPPLPASTHTNVELSLHDTHSVKHSTCIITYSSQQFWEVSPIIILILKMKNLRFG